MSPLITDRGQLLDSEMRQLAQRRLLFALSRFELRITRVDLVVQDENGPRGGIDKCCRIEVQLRRAANVIIVEKGADWGRCLSRAVDRTARAVARAIEKRQFAGRSRSVIDWTSSLN